MIDDGYCRENCRNHLKKRARNRPAGKKQKVSVAGAVSLLDCNHTVVNILQMPDYLVG